MKMNYRLIRNVKTKGRLLEFGPPLFFIGVILLFHFFYPSLLASAVSRAASPFWRVERFMSKKMDNMLLFFSSKQRIAKDVTRLSGDLEKAYRLLLDRDLLYEENELLREQLGRTEKKEPRIVGAILVTPPRSPYDTAVLDVGAEHGVEVGALALSGSVVLGRVSKAYSRTSVIEFFSTAGTKISLSILHEGIALPVEGVGKGGGEFSATLPTEVSVSVGDKVVIPGLNPLAFATVEAIERSVTDSFQVVRFKNPLSIHTLRFLEIEPVSISEQNENSH